MLFSLRRCAGLFAFLLVMTNGSMAPAASPWMEIEALETHRIPELHAAPFESEPKSTPWGGWYAGLHVGAFTIADMKFAGNGSELFYEFDPGVMMGGSLGYAFDFGLRFESELSYRVAQADTFELSGVTFSGSGNIHTLSVMLNSWFDIKFLSFMLGDWVPYLGGGAGVVHAWSNVGNIGVPLVDATDYQLAWQGGGGLAYEITDSVFFSLDYRFLRTFGSFSFDDPAYPEPFKAKYKTHAITLGLRGFF